jgi:hypothetical protein
MRIDEGKVYKGSPACRSGVEAVPRRGSSRLGNGQLRVTGTGREGTDSKSHVYSLILRVHESQMLSTAGSGCKYMTC